MTFLENKKNVISDSTFAGLANQIKKADYEKWTTLPDWKYAGTEALKHAPNQPGVAYGKGHIALMEVLGIRKLSETPSVRRASLVSTQPTNIRRASVASVREMRGDLTGLGGTEVSRNTLDAERVSKHNLTAGTPMLSNKTAPSSTVTFQRTQKQEQYIEFFAAKKSNNSYVQELSGSGRTSGAEVELAKSEIWIGSQDGFKDLLKFFEKEEPTAAKTILEAEAKKLAAAAGKEVTPELIQKLRRNHVEQYVVAEFARKHLDEHPGSKVSHAKGREYLTAQDNKYHHFYLWASLKTRTLDELDHYVKTGEMLSK